MPTVALIGIPFDQNSTYLRGPALAPPLIRQALHSPSANLWSELGIEINPSLVSDYGDLPVHSNTELFDQSEQVVNRAHASGLKPLFLGGDHAITYPIVKALAKPYPDLHILHFDAHPDLYHEFSGNPLSHACPFARIMENGLAAELTQIGIRCFNDHQRRQAERFGVQSIEMKDLHNLEKIVSHRPVYISFDLDVLDPAFAPGVSHFEPGGLSTRQAIQLLHSVSGNIIGADLVEYNPIRDFNGLTAMTAAKILKELIALLCRA